MDQIQDLRKTIESMEKVLKNVVESKSVDKDHIEDFMSYTTTSLANLCGIVDILSENSK